MGKPTVIELFAGVGGFRLGLEASGWETVFSNQWEPSTKTQHASSCYVANFGTSGHSNEDIKVVLDSFEAGSFELPDADLIVGGFPCQDYSVAKSLNSSKGLEGKKGVLWWEIHRLVAAKKPKFVFLENVDRLLKSPASQRGRDFAIMLRTLGDLGYRVEWRVVNAAEEGFPQRRIRVFIVASRLDVAESISGYENPEKYLTSDGILGQAFPATSEGQVQRFVLDKDPEKITSDFNATGSSSPFLTAGVMQGDEVYTLKTKSAKKGKGLTLGDVLQRPESVPDSYWIEYEALKAWEYLKGAKSITRVHASSGTEYKYSEGKMAFPDALDKPSRTILTGEGGSTPSRFKHVIEVDGKYRRLLPIELERLNGFPDNWTQFDATGKPLGDARRAFFMGNALVVGLIEQVGKVIRPYIQ
jgi:DNA (cytosine-5)-methyltransferase 1